MFGVLIRICIGSFTLVLGNFGFGAGEFVFVIRVTFIIRMK